MKYIIMFMIVFGLAGADFVTGYIKARCADRVSSKALRIGGLHKAAELVIMATAIGLTVGLDMLGKYYTDTRLTDLAGFVTALGGVLLHSSHGACEHLGKFRRDNARSKMGEENH